VCPKALKIVAHAFQERIHPQCLDEAEAEAEEEEEIM
jgi:hypothetical protein